MEKSSIGVRDLKNACVTHEIRVSDTSKNKAFIQAVANREAKGLSKDNTEHVGSSAFSRPKLLFRQGRPTS